MLGCMGIIVVWELGWFDVLSGYICEMNIILFIK